jgi:hypothetical protein
MSCCDYGCNQGKNCPARESIIDPKTCVRVNTYGKYNLKKDNLNMTDFYKLYKLYRVAHGRRYALRRAYEITFKGIPF